MESGKSSLLKSKVVSLFLDIAPSLSSICSINASLANNIAALEDTILKNAIVIEKRYNTTATLKSIDVEIEVLRNYLFVAEKLSYISKSTAIAHGESVDEIGRIIGSMLNNSRRG